MARTKKIVACKPVTNRLIFGTINERGTMFVGPEVDVTDSAVAAVAQHLIQLQESLVFAYADGKNYKLQVVPATEADLADTVLEEKEG